MGTVGHAPRDRRALERDEVAPRWTRKYAGSHPDPHPRREPFQPTSNQCVLLDTRTQVRRSEVGHTMITDSLTHEAIQPSLFDRPLTPSAAARAEPAVQPDATSETAPEGYVWAVRDSNDPRIRFHHLVPADAVGESTLPACRRGRAGAWVVDGRVAATEPCQYCSRKHLTKLEGGGSQRWTWPAWIDEDLPCRQPGQDPEMFHSDDPAERAKAKAGCAECPFKQECLQLRVALRAKSGIWGGQEFGRPKQRTDPDSTCWNGHPWVEETTGVRAGRKYCMVCADEASLVAEDRAA